jgi:hypothetical protein
MARRRPVDFGSHPLLASLEKVSPAKIRRFRKEHPGIQEDYLAFLQNVGFGSIGDCQLALYSGPISPSDVYDPVTAHEVGDVVLFGDDFQGYCSGFDARGRVVEVDPRGETRVVAPTFTRFLSSWLADEAALIEQASEPDAAPAVKKKRPTTKRKAGKSPKK